MSNDLAGKVFLVTGATEGIGKAAALDFAKRDATMVLVGRNREKTERVVADLKSESGNQKIELLLGDLSLLADVRSIAEKFRANHDRLDVLVNNAGALFQDYRLTKEGFEQTFALNHLGYFLLTHEVLDLLRKTPGSRVISTASGAHSMGSLELPFAVKRDGSAGFRAYGDSKLANILFTRELGKRLQGSGVTANCFHPGFVETGFGQNNGSFWRNLIKVGASMFARTPQKGAETLIWLATSPEAAGFQGEYFHDLQVAKRSKRARSDELATKLWALSEDLCGVANAT